ncbi:MAG: hypothetical protein RL358_323 [Pseudomonadota bacterium]|jgi:diguanylate cyclase (GGDEF)-like protein
MSLKTKFFLLFVAVFLLFMATFWGFTQYWVAGINNDWAMRLTEKQVLFDKHRTLHPLLREIVIARKMAAEPALVDMVLYPNDEQVAQRGRAMLESYRNKFQSRSYFAAFSGSQQYYLHENETGYAERKLAYVMSPNNPVDAWFYATLAHGRDVVVNVNIDGHDADQLAHVWIDVVMKHDGKVIGVVGTGLHLREFLQESVAMDQAGVTNLIVDSEMAIQLNRDPQMIDLASITKSTDQRLKVDVLLTRADDIKNLRIVMQRLMRKESASEMLRVNYHGREHLLGVAYIPELDWFDLTLIDAHQGVLFAKLWWVAGLFGVLFLSVLALVAWMLHRWLLNPMAILKKAMHEVELNHYASIPPLVGSAEIKSLSQQFNLMAEHIRSHHQELEDKVQQRTQALDESLAQVQKLAFYDALTSLPNRRLLGERLSHAKLEGKRSGHYGALMFLDLDKFKPLNDLYGHEMGDLMLIEVARRLQSCVREVDTVARFGGDEFVVVLGALVRDFTQSEIQAGNIAEKIRGVLAEPYFLQAQQGEEVLHYSAGSIGVTLFQGQIVKADDLLKRADMAMYQAKQAGRNRVCFHR